MTDAVRTEALVKRYPSRLRWREGRTALAGLDLTVPAGGITGLLGPNGAGKTTTVRILLGLARPTSGSARVFGLDAVRDSLAIRREVAFVPEERSMFGWMRAGQLARHVAALSPAWDRPLAMRLARAWGIEEGMRLRELSPGTRSRLMLLVALARRARLLVLDEPTAGLDPATVDEALSELALAAADGATVLLVTHRLEEVERICDRVAVVSGGRAVLQGDLDELRGDWRTVDVVGHPAPARLGTWEEVSSVAIHGERARLLVRSAPDAVVARLRMLGAEVTDVRPVSLREIYLAATRADGDDAARPDLA